MITRNLKVTPLLEKEKNLMTWHSSLDLKERWKEQSNVQKFELNLSPPHNTYTRNNMGQKCEGNCGLCVQNEIIKKTYTENLKKIVGAVWELPAK